MADEATLDEVVGLISKLADKLETISGRLDALNRIDVLEGRISLVERTIAKLDDLRIKMSKVEEAICKNNDCLEKNTAGLAHNTETLNGMNK